jgi:hypothetical protein
MNTEKKTKKIPRYIFLGFWVNFELYSSEDTNFDIIILPRYALRMHVAS